MTIHTTTADQNGNFSINIGTALTNGETIEVTAQKDDQSKTIVIQAPSEPYFPPESEGNNIKKLTFPMYSIYTESLISGGRVIYDGNGATQTSVDNIHTLTNNYFKKDQLIRMFFIFKIKLDDFKLFNDNDDVFKLRQGILNNDGSIDYQTDGFFYKKHEIVGYESSQNMFLIDDDYLYVLTHSSINYSSETNTDIQSNYAYTITYNGVEHTFKANKVYVESD